ncbi:MAG: metallophosphoesterase family protein [Gemmatimonadaceae bacterium]
MSAATPIRIAVITDAHANLPALRTALAAIDDIGVDALYHTGDLVAIGPHPAECAELLLRRPHTHFVMGNHDDWFAFGLPTPRPEWMTEGEWEHQRWTHARLPATLRQTVSLWPDSVQLDLGGTLIRFVHYARKPGGAFHGAPTPLTSGARADELFGPSKARVLFYGHNHDRSDLVGLTTRYVNPGSLGCSREAVARFAIVESRPGARYALTLHAEPYDPAALLSDFDTRYVPERDFIRRTFMPQRFEVRSA